MEDLKQKSCKACRGMSEKLSLEKIRLLQGQISSEWQLVQNHHLERVYLWKNFQEALDFTNRVGNLAEQEGHHPEIQLGWGRVKLLVWTHKVDGLTENDFIFAAKCDTLQLFPLGKLKRSES